MQHGFFKYRMGDANVHAIAVMMMHQSSVEMHRGFPYTHNSNDDHRWGQKALAWQEECKSDRGSVPKDAIV
jgi:hypothetical protein